MITRTFKLCLNAGSGSAPYINVNQYDEGETWLFELYSENGERYIPSSGAIVGVKSDGHGIVNTGTVDSEGRVVITETQQMTAAAGKAEFELLIENQTHGTANFIVDVEQRAGENAIPSESDLSLLQEAIDSAAEIEDLLDGQDVPTVITPIITDWLDENITNPSNPPIDTSLTVAGAAADAKKTGDEITDLKSALEIVNSNDSELGFSVTANMLESGRIDDHGEPVANSSRVRTKDFIPVSKDDTVLIIADDTFNQAVMISYYDTAKTFISNSSWYYFNYNYDTYPVISSAGYIKLTFSNADKTLFADCVRIARTSKKYEKLLAIESSLNASILPIPSELIVLGYWTAAHSFRTSSTRATLRYPIKVNEGDEIHFTAKNDLLVDIGFQFEGASTVTFRGYSNMPYKCPKKGNVYFTFRKSDNSTITDVSEWGNIITVVRNNEYKSVETTDSSMLYNGYINASNAITDHSTRLVNWQPIHANKGDIVRINSMDLMYQPYEYNSAGQRLTNASTYITPTYVGGNLPTCGDYIVQNDDCWIMCVIAPTYGFTPSSFKPSDYPSPFSVIHIEKDRCINTAEDTMFRFPKSARKPIPFNTSAVVSQACTIVNGKLWAGVEVSGGQNYIQVINLETGEIEKTINHNLGHLNSLDYCAKTDTIITVDSTTDYQTILLYEGASGADSIAKSDCVSISVATSTIDQMATCCFGQDEREIFIYCGYGSDTPYNLYKMILGYSNGHYSGTVATSKTYTGVIRDGIDTYVTPGTTAYAQDSCYDGYFYLAYGTSGHNFLVIDLDDVHDTYRVVGNYLHHEYKSDYTEYGVEPEGVALHDGKIYCLSRQNTAQLSFFNVFTR